MNVLIADTFEPSGLADLQKTGCAVTYEPQLDAEGLLDFIADRDVDVLVVRSKRVTKPIIEAARNLKLIVRAGSGYDTIDVAAATEHGIAVSNCPGQNSVAVAELTVGMMIALDRRIVDNTDDLRRGVWNKKEYSKARGLKGRTLGIVGMGRIGFEVAKRAAAFDMRIIYTDVVHHAEAERLFGARHMNLEQVLTQSDFVTVHVPGGPGTHHMIGARQLAMMKPTAFLINCSRGGIVDESALAHALQANHLGGAALDVFEIEPTAGEHDFRDPIPRAPHVYGTHHIGASTDQAQSAVAAETVRIIHTFATEHRVLNWVNPVTPAMA
ncbi:MAG: hydroxyacid dehydrogenase [Phycisphaerales bacterium]|nr:hydroxyacid dehydrogenase [Phycisphaerales bacterium]